MASASRTEGPSIWVFPSGRVIDSSSTTLSTTNMKSCRRVAAAVDDTTAVLGLCSLKQRTHPSVGTPTTDARPDTHISEKPPVHRREIRDEGGQSPENSTSCAMQSFIVWIAGSAESETKRREIRRWKRAQGNRDHEDGARSSVCQPSVRQVSGVLSKGLFCRLNCIETIKRKTQK